jgi:hypothetical protein
VTIARAMATRGVSKRYGSGATELMAVKGI